jgi:hypothetical protein
LKPAIACINGSKAKGNAELLKKKKLALTLHKNRKRYKTRFIKQGQVIVFFS